MAAVPRPIDDSDNFVSADSVRSPTLAIWLRSRAAIWAAALLSLFTFQHNRIPFAGRWDDPNLTHDLGAVTDVWTRWDSVWFLSIAEHGYRVPSHAVTAFYPLYPATIAGLGHVLAGHYLLAGLLAVVLPAGAAVAARRFTPSRLAMVFHPELVVCSAERLTEARHNLARLQASLRRQRSTGGLLDVPGQIWPVCRSTMRLSRARTRSQAHHRASS